MPRDVGLGDKVYSPDLTTFELEGPTGLFGTIASVIVGPLRFIMRVTHNIFVLPAHLLSQYARVLHITCGIMTALGIADYLIYKKWPLLVSQVPVWIYALHIKRKAAYAVEITQQKREVELDTAQVSELCNQIYDELNEIVEKDD